MSKKSEVVEEVSTNNVIVDTDVKAKEAIETL